ncbi:MAG: hypothetical protein DRJ55_04165 [Thermoprotei archaeon]|nr:MAG: hypothetical protein DRJ46_03955 [Thermoprotei archaeon]RLE92913.1 MAG: hypothetical protein DRJ55_04165 [Thermoprotei archaeon]
MAPKVRIEDTLPTGEKIVLSIEGPELSEKRVLQAIELLKIMTAAETGTFNKRKLKDELWEVIVENFGDGSWFTLKELYLEASRRLNVKVTLVGSYLSRFVAEGRLVKKGSKPRTLYRVRAAYVHQT